MRSAAAPAPASAGPSTDTAAATRALRAIAIHLVNGAEPEALLGRLAAIGLSEAEARRVLATAEANPLVAAGRALAQQLRARDAPPDGAERLRGPVGARVERRVGIDAEEFRDRYLAAGRPVILLDELSDWPALAKWTPFYLSNAIGDAIVDVRDQRAARQGRREMAFDRFIDLGVRVGAAGGAVMTLDGTARNAAALAPLHADLGALERFLAPQPDQAQGTLVVGPAGSIAALNPGPGSALVAQLAGRRRLRIVGPQAGAPAAGIGNDPGAVPDRQVYDVTLSPGEIIVLPSGWQAEAQAIDFTASVTYTRLR